MLAAASTAGRFVSVRTVSVATAVVETPTAFEITQRNVCPFIAGTVFVIAWADQTAPTSAVLPENHWYDTGERLVTMTVNVAGTPSMTTRFVGCR